MTTTCPQCRERPATTRIRWHAVLPILLSGGPVWFGKVCKDCAGGLNFLGLLGLAAILVAAFVVAVIVW